MDRDVHTAASQGGRHGYRMLAAGGLGATLVMQDIGRHLTQWIWMQKCRLRSAQRLPSELADFMAGDPACAPPGPLAEMHAAEIGYRRDAAKPTGGGGIMRCSGAQAAGQVPRVECSVLATLGVAGTIYNDMIEVLMAMQVAGNEALHCAGKLHDCHSVCATQTKWSQGHTRQRRDAG
jgi:hypothetical protein